MKSIQETLLKKNVFHGAYYLYGPSREVLTKNHILDWFSFFYNNYLQRSHSLKRFQDPSNAPDVLFIHPDEKQNFKAEQFSQIYPFQGTRPINGSYKFCIIPHCSEISETIWNKLLKTLEEPQNNLVFLLFDSTKSNLLSTVFSRVLPLRLLPGDLQLMGINQRDSSERKFHKLFQESIVPEKGFSHFLQKYTEMKDLEKEVLSDFCLWFSDITTTPKPFKDKFLSLLKWLEESKLYHNPLSERAYFVYQFAKTIQQYEKSL